MPEYLSPSRTNSLLLCVRPRPDSAFLVIGSNRLAAARVFTALEAGYKVFVAYPAHINIDPELSYRVNVGDVTYIALEESRLLDIISELPDLDVVCITDSLQSSVTIPARRNSESCAAISHFCRSRKIHINIVDKTSLNDISFPATHRWRSSDGNIGHYLQIAVNTFGKGCRLATRIKREIVTALPPEIGRAVDNIAIIRSRIVDIPSTSKSEAFKSGFDEEDDQVIAEPLNTPVTQLTPSSGYFSGGLAPSHESELEARARRMKWVAQVSEYWPIRTIGRLQDIDIERILTDFDGSKTPKTPLANATPVASRTPSHSNLSSLHLSSTLMASNSQTNQKVIDIPRNANDLSESGLTIHKGTPTTLHDLNISRPSHEKVSTEPRVLLLGSGPGHPSLLTVAAYNALRTADLVLADKLVPAAVLQLIPPTVKTTIAKKFPGNAENAQIELQQFALEFLQERRAASQGGTVVRLKQGDPYIYGRGGEEVLFFRQYGFEAIIVPGISSSIAAPLLCNIPVTQRGVSDSLILCTGVGRAGKTSIMPGFRRSRTLIVLMGVARIGELIKALTSDSEVVGTRREAEQYPPHLPIALIERGSSKDQRMLLSTLAGIEDAIDRVADQRPPGMLVIGWCCLALEGTGNVDVTEPAGIQAGENGDRERVHRILGDKGYLVRDGVRPDWMEFLDQMALVKM